MKGGDRVRTPIRHVLPVIKQWNASCLVPQHKFPLALSSAGQQAVQFSTYFAGPHEAMRRQQESKQLRNFATPAVSNKMFLYSHEDFTRYFSSLQKHFPKTLIEDRIYLAKVWVDKQCFQQCLRNQHHFCFNANLDHKDFATRCSINQQYPT
jgi:hypothetical protein